MTQEIKRTRKTENPTLQEQIENSVNDKPIQAEEIIGPEKEGITEEMFIPSGVTLINCGCTDNPYGAFIPGTINTVPGRSSSGKTELMMTMLAMTAADKRFNDYILIDDDAEHSNSFNLEYLFPVLVDRLKAPRYDGEVPVYSNSIEDFEANILTLCKKSKQPFIYVLDSLDSLTSSAEIEREWKNALKNTKDSETLKEIQKSYGTEKARKISEVLRLVNGYIKKSKSLLFIIQQTKQYIAPAGMPVFGAPDWTTTGGEAPFFYSYHRLFLDTGAAIKDEHRKIKHRIGGITRGEIVKNKWNGKKRKSGIEFKIYEDYGIDDIDSCIEFLKTTEEWYVEGPHMVAPGFLENGEKMFRENLIKAIEAENAEREVQAIVGKVWREIEDGIRLKDRKRRF